MSTRIHGGLRIDTRDVLAFADDVRRVCQPVLRTLQLTELAELSARVIAEGKPRRRSAVYESADRFRKLMDIVGPSDSLHDPFRFELQVMRASKSSQTLGILYTSSQAESAYLEALYSLGYVHEHAYWNDVDRPEHMTVGEWKARRDDWDDALGDEGIPGKRGVTIELGVNTMRIDQHIDFRGREDPVWEEIVALQPESDTPFTVEQLLSR